MPKPTRTQGITAAILAGGRGTRLRSILGNWPKPLAEVGARPYVTHLLDQLDSASVHSVVLLTGYKASQVRRTLGDNYRDLQLVYSQEPSELGTGGAVRWALPHLASSPVLLMNGDSWCDVNLELFLDFHYFHRARLSIVLTKQRDTSRYGALDVAPDGRVCRFKEKDNSRSPGWINAGIYLFDRGLIADIPSRSPFSLEKQLIPQWIQEKKDVFGFHTFGAFIDIGTPRSYRQAVRLFSSRTGISPIVKSGLTGKGWN
jgi:NDP-sugar pyrophosphorylase family protein